MSEELIINDNLTKAEKYAALIPQIEALVGGETDLVANLANIAAALKEGMGFFWVGFYIVKEEELVLGPFQGPIACTRIRKGKGVCGAAWAEAKTYIVEDVDQFPGHIACSADSKSEIVLPGFKEDQVALILDVDSDQISAFDAEDQSSLERLMRVIETFI
jgi:GAF domain-containing protein